MGLSLLCRISGAVHLVQLGLMLGWLAGRRNPGDFQDFTKFTKIIDFALFNKRTALLQQYQCI